MIAGGLVLLTVIADRAFGFEVTRREWISVALAAAGLAFLAATIEGGAGTAHSHYTGPTLAIFIAAVASLGVLVAVLGRETPRAGVLFGASAGLLWAASDTAIKADSGKLGDGATAVLLNPLALTIALASLVGLLVSARSLQIGPAVPVIAVTSVAANATTIAAGPIVFETDAERHPSGLARLLAFALVIGAAALTPPPIEIEAELP